MTNIVLRAGRARYRIALILSTFRFRSKAALVYFAPHTACASGFMLADGSQVCKSNHNRLLEGYSRLRKVTGLAPYTRKSALSVAAENTGPTFRNGGEGLEMAQPPTCCPDTDEIS